MTQVTPFFKNQLFSVCIFTLCYEKNCLLTVNKLLVHRLLILFIFTLYIAEILYDAIVGLKATNPNQLMRINFGQSNSQFCKAKWYFFKASCLSKKFSLYTITLSIFSFQPIPLVIRKPVSYFSF